MTGNEYQYSDHKDIYCYPNTNILINKFDIKLKTEKYLANLEKTEFISRLAFFMGEINALHPFREGNGRTQRVYFGYLCQDAGYGIEFSKIDKGVHLQADIGAFNRNYDLLLEVLDIIVSEQT